MNVRRPTPSTRRIEGLVLIAEHFRPKVAARAGEGLFQLRRGDKVRIAAAIEYVDQLVDWKRARGSKR